MGVSVYGEWLTKTVTIRRKYLLKRRKKKRQEMIRRGKGTDKWEGKWKGKEEVE